MQIEELRPGSLDRRAFSFLECRHVTTPEAIARLRELADRARRLPPPDHRNPHAFHEARDELGQELEQLADQLSKRGES